MQVESVRLDPHLARHLDHGHLPRDRKDLRMERLENLAVDVAGAVAAIAAVRPKVHGRERKGCCRQSSSLSPIRQAAVAVTWKIASIALPSLCFPARPPAVRHEQLLVMVESECFGREGLGFGTLRRWQPAPRKRTTAGGDRTNDRREYMKALRAAIRYVEALRACVRTDPSFRHIRPRNFETNVYLRSLAIAGLLKPCPLPEWLTGSSALRMTRAWLSFISFAAM